MRIDPSGAAAPLLSDRTMDLFLYGLIRRYAKSRYSFLLVA